MNIGQASVASGVSAKMIRYYESTGLIAPAQRSLSGYRVYTGADVEALRLIGRARDLGFDTAQIRALLALWRDRERAARDVRQLALEHVAELRRKMQQLDEMARTLETLAGACAGGSGPDCAILDDLARSSASAGQRRRRRAGPASAKARAAAPPAADLPAADLPLSGA